MKIDLKLIFLVLIVVILVSEIDGWGSRRRSSSRSPSRRGGWGGSRRRSYSSRRRAVSSRRRAVSSRRRALSSRRRSSWSSRRRAVSSRRRAVSSRRRTSWTSRRRAVSSRRRSSWLSRRRAVTNSRRRSGFWSRRRSTPKPKKKPGSGWWRSRPSKSKPKKKPGSGWLFSRPSKPKSKPSKNAHVSYPNGIKTPRSKQKFGNSKVVSVKHMERPLKNVPKSWYNKGYGNYKLKHAGVVVTTASGRKYMIENSDFKGGKNVKITRLGKNGLGKKWRVTKGKGTKPVKNKKMKDFIGATKPGYNVPFNNCQQTSNTLYPLGKRGRMCKVKG